MSEDEIRERINGKHKQSVLVSRCRVVSEGKECGHIFVVDHSKMGHDKPETDPRIVHLQEFHHLKDVHNKPVIRLDKHVNTRRLSGKYNRQKIVFTNELYLTQEQIDRLCRILSDWHSLNAKT